MSYFTYLKFRVPEGLLRTIFSPTVYDVQRAYCGENSDVTSLGSESFPFGCLNRETYNTKPTHSFPNGFISQTLTP